MVELAFQRPEALVGELSDVAPGQELAALDSSLTAIRRNLRTVVSLSVLLVLAPDAQLGLWWPMISPATTTASTPETCSASPSR